MQDLLDPHAQVAIVSFGVVWPGPVAVCRSAEAYWDLCLGGAGCVTSVGSSRWPGEGRPFLDARQRGFDKITHDRACIVDAWQLQLEQLQQQLGNRVHVSKLDRPAQFAVASAFDAIERCSRWAQSDPKRRRLFLGNIALPTEGSQALFDGYLSGVQDKEPARYADTLNEPARALAAAFQIEGGAHTLDAACASSLFALWEGARELLADRADVVLAGGLNAADSLYTQMGFEQLGAISKKGTCTPFDQSSDGLIVGEGGCVFVLKRVADALSDGDHIYGVIRGGGLSNDREGGLLLPSVEGQLRAMRSAYDVAKICPSTIDYFECHATGTPTGDRIELSSLVALLQEAPQSEQPVALGATKANVGHWLTGAGAASMLKVLGMLHRKKVSPLSGFEQWASPLRALPLHYFRTPLEQEDWPEFQQRRRRAALSGFGFGGTNAHLIVEAFDSRDYQPDSSSRAKLRAPTPSQFVMHSGQSCLGDREVRVPGVGPLAGHEIAINTLGMLELGVRFLRVSPRELEKSMPQQVSLLYAAKAAWDEARSKWSRQEASVASVRCGVYAAIDLDLRSCAFSKRWHQIAAGQLPSPSIAPLDPERTLGHLGGIVASRVARELGCGGPSYVLSGSDGGIKIALERACAAISAGDIDHAIVAAVRSLDNELDATLLALASRGDVSNQSQEGAIAFVVSRALATDSRSFTYAKLERFETPRRNYRPALAHAARVYESVTGTELQSLALRQAVDTTIQLPMGIRYTQTGVPVSTAQVVYPVSNRAIEPRQISVAFPEPFFDLDQAALFDAQSAYVAAEEKLQSTLQLLLNWQLDLLEHMPEHGTSARIEGPTKSAISDEYFRVRSNSESETIPPRIDRVGCLILARGQLADVLGPEFSEVDRFPTRVRLPDEPLMLVDRIMSIDATPRSMSSGSIVTEHDVTGDRWYLDNGHIPTCVAVEAGQADLFLSSYLGIDFETRGLAMYRLLDAVVTFHDALPVVGETIRYAIQILRFFRQGEGWFFRFQFDATVGGRPLMTMREGCAGFFTQSQLEAGKGVVRSPLDHQRESSIPDGFSFPIRPSVQHLQAKQIEALTAGDLVGAFGSQFAGLRIDRPNTIPGGKLRLVHRVSQLDPQGGRFNRGKIVAQADIHPDDWFLTCHFVDDKVMPGTLMYECCLHSLRILLLAQGWVGSRDDVRWEPVLGVQSRLKCRGQVLETTRVVTYEVEIREIGFRPEPYVIVDALMYADDKAIVDITDMSLQLTGSSKAALESLWSKTHEGKALEFRPAVYDYDKILAYSTGRPSEAFGDPYRIFDSERKIARLPRPPFQFLDRIVEVRGEPFVCRAGAACVAQVRVDATQWYFAANRQDAIPFSILLEIALQPCGWLAAYAGSALLSKDDLCFRNLGGSAKLHARVEQDVDDILTTSVELTKVSVSAGMIVQEFSFDVRSEARGCSVYSGTTQFGFFSPSALERQVGIRGARPYCPGASTLASAGSFKVSDIAPMPSTKMRMIDRVDAWIPDGGAAGLGWIRGSIDVDPDFWFFDAHFYQDPVWPGSLGLEAFLQLLKTVALQKWPAAGVFTTHALSHEHRWTYRGQVVPHATAVIVEAEIIEVDSASGRLVANGWLSVDGRVIYQMENFALEAMA